jgi:hypothetical protein
MKCELSDDGGIAAKTQPVLNRLYQWRMDVYRF